MDQNGRLTLSTPGKGIVIKATNFHSNQGVFVLTNETSQNNGPGQVLDLIRRTSYEYDDIVAALDSMQASKIIVEEFIGTSLPTEYKLHVINGKVQAIDVIQNRGEDCACFAVVDSEFNRLDYHGCFEPGGTSFFDPRNPECIAIDFDTGGTRAGPVKKDMYLCQDVVKPPPCVIKDMMKMAESLGARIGVAMRVDVFVTNDNKVYVQEYSPNPMNGLRHCTAKVDEQSGCVDSCFLGREWKASAADPVDLIYGGNSTEVPNKLVGYLDKVPDAQCALIDNVSPKTEFVSTCE